MLDMFRALYCQKSINEIRADASAEEYIETAYLATESIKAIASKMSPEAG